MQRPESGMRNPRASAANAASQHNKRGVWGLYAGAGIVGPGFPLLAWPAQRPRTANRACAFGRDRQPCAWQVGRMTTAEAIRLLEKFRAGGVSRDEVLRAFQAAPIVDLGFAKLDTHRGLRRGFPEVVFGLGKTPAQLVRIADALFKQHQRVLITRVSAEQARVVKRKFKRAVYHEPARCITIEARPLPKRKGMIAIVSAGTGDLPVAEEAAVTAEFMGNKVERVHDVGVAGLHRLLGHLEVIQRANVIIVVAGMEGALPSVVAGLVDRPVIAVPTSIGYGASFGGVAALLAMLNSCSGGVTVVNIDNGFGAAYAASLINGLVPGR